MSGYSSCDRPPWRLLLSGCSDCSESWPSKKRGQYAFLLSDIACCFLADHENNIAQTQTEQMPREIFASRIFPVSYINVS